MFSWSNFVCLRVSRFHRPWVLELPSQSLPLSAPGSLPALQTITPFVLDSSWRFSQQTLWVVIAQEAHVWLILLIMAVFHLEEPVSEPWYFAAGSPSDVSGLLGGTESLSQKFSFNRAFPAKAIPNVPREDVLLALMMHIYVYNHGSRRLEALAIERQQLNICTNL